jgi:hypothetical protein
VPATDLDVKLAVNALRKAWVQHSDRTDDEFEGTSKISMNTLTNLRKEYYQDYREQIKYQFAA